MTSPLKPKILNLIRANGPIGVSDYMLLALYDSEHGYYTTRDPLGVDGDFTTSPEVSQIFGELIGVFLVQAWEDRGRPKRFHLAELGPGRGTLMADILRTSRVRPGFGEAAHVTLIETSPALRAAQAKILGSGAIRWVSALDEIPADAPLFLVANEFFDALPVRQFVKAKGGWHERMVAADGDKLVFALAPAATPLDAPDAPEGAVFEISPAARAIANLAATRIARTDGVALIVDYGHAHSGCLTESRLGDTFQAVKAHKPADPLAEPGEADLTAHVDFTALSDAARAAEGYVFGPTPQGYFLDQLGIKQRAERLKRAAPNEAKDIDAAVHRLADPDQMGTLFKVMAICEDASPGVPGFPC
jgi:NADH dehydrogenase [ubiquinone] 1 alpha subcomplex assembly factor 7